MGEKPTGDHAQATTPTNRRNGERTDLNPLILSGLPRSTYFGGNIDEGCFESLKRGKEIKR